MKIDIRAEAESGTETLSMENEGIENDNYVTIHIAEVDIDVSIDELMSAVGAFVNLRALRLEREKSYE